MTRWTSSAFRNAVFSRSCRPRPKRRIAWPTPRRLAAEPLEGRALLAAIAGVPNPNEAVTTSVTASQLASALVGAGVSVSNATFTGGATAKGAFAFTDPAVIGFSTGILLSSGNAADVVGPNAADWTSTDFTNSGDSDLTQLSGYPTYDAAVLEFDFVPTANQVVFSYAFASDEYPEWVNTPFNDVFAFYVNGTNYATVRATAGDPTAPFVPVAVNNINNGNPEIYPDFVPRRPDLFRSNYVNPTGGPSALDLELDGITHVLTFQAPVNPGVLNHMKLAIADASDGIYDSAVFIQAGSLVSNYNPVADLSLSTEHSVPGATVTAYVEGEDPQGAPLSYTIDWGDGTQSTGELLYPELEEEKTAQVDHVYATTGDFLVTLTVSNGTLDGVSVEDITIGSVQVGPPVVTLQPSDQTAAAGSPFTFSAAATGLPAPSVQWQVSTDSGATFVNIPGATSASYSGVAALASDGYLYRAVFTSSEGSATTAAATLFVAADEFAPVVTAHPADQEVSVGDLFNFTAAASGLPAPSVQWQVSTDGGESWADIAGATATTYSGLAAETDDGSQYRAVFTNDLGEAMSQAATLSVSTEDVDLAVTADPVNQSVVAGAAFTFTAAAVGAQAVQWQVSLDGGVSFTDIPGATSASYSGQAALVDDGNQYRAVFFEDAEDLEEGVVTAPATLSVRPAAPYVALAHDTGASTNDNLTSDGSLVVSGLAAGAAVEYSADNGTTWNASFMPAEGLNTVLVRQVIGAGSPSDATSLSFVLDTTLPQPPRADLAQDTGRSAVDHITSVGTVVLTHLEGGTLVEFSVDGGGTWSQSFTAVEGPNLLKVRQTDAAGNTSDEALLSFLLDTADPAAPLVALAHDTGASSGDGLTRDGSLALGGLELDALVEYSTDGGATWTESFAAAEGANAVQVRQTDPAGNVSQAATLDFTLDTAPPELHPAFSTGSDFFLVNQKNVTLQPNATDNVGIATESAGSIDTATPGAKTVTCTATDLAGNTTSVEVAYTVGYALLTVGPVDGIMLRQKGQLTVWFQLGDANGVLSDQAAASLLPSVAVSVDGAAAVNVRYNKRANLFTADVKLNKLSRGLHTAEIEVSAGDAVVAGQTIRFLVL